MKKVAALLVVLVSFFAFAQDAMMDAMKMVESHAWGSAELVNARTG
jgi:hypothetical protein